MSDEPKKCLMHTLIRVRVTKNNKHKIYYCLCGENQMISKSA
jgi:hypothetical protein